MFSMRFSTLKTLHIYVLSLFSLQLLVISEKSEKQNEQKDQLKLYTNDPKKNHHPIHPAITLVRSNHPGMPVELDEARFPDCEG